MTAEKLIKALQLEPLPGEGGMFRSTYVSSEKIGDAPIGTAIYYLLTEQSFSHLHKLPSDEMYHFYLGDPVELLELLPDGTHAKTILGSDVLNSQYVQYLVKADIWQGSRLVEGGKFALLGTTMSPGYTSDGYIHADKDELIKKYPLARELIQKLTGDAVFA